MAAKTGSYSLRSKWLGDSVHKNADYARASQLSAANKADIAASSDPALGGDETRWNPEELLLAALSTCHQLSYLALAKAKGVEVLSYEDNAAAEAVFAGPGRLTKAILRPRISLPIGSDVTLARELHKTAHRICFIANSVNFEVEIIGEFDEV